SVVNSPLPVGRAPQAQASRAFLGENYVSLGISNRFGQFGRQRDPEAVIDDALELARHKQGRLGRSHRNSANKGTPAERCYGLRSDHCIVKGLKPTHNAFSKSRLGVKPKFQNTAYTTRMRNANE